VTGAKVVDPSVVAAILFGEPEAEAAVQRIGDARLIAPTLLAFELANVCLTKCRRHPDRRNKLIAAYALRERFGIEEVAVEVEAALGLAETTGLTVYDASYRSLARAHNVSLVTFDRALDRAAMAGKTPR
jgi:predicted nucleic acid-binding protein